MKQTLFLAMSERPSSSGGQHRQLLYGFFIQKDNFLVRLENSKFNFTEKTLTLRLENRPSEGKCFFLSSSAIRTSSLTIEECIGLDGREKN